jgi:hypothetical protein
MPREIVQVRHAVHTTVEFEILFGSQVAVEQRLVRNDTQDAADFAGAGRQMVAPHTHLPSGWTRKRGQDAQERGLPGAVGAKQGYKFTFVNLEIQSAQNRLQSKGFHQSVDLNHPVPA